MEDLKTRYIKTIKPELAKKYKIENPMAVPEPTKVVVNMGLGEATKDSSIIELMEKVLEQITGQKSVRTQARKSIAEFNLRQGQVIGLKVTLRGDKMWHFIEKLAQIVLPRVKDFQGIPLKGFDESGNYALGLKDYTAFPEIDIAKVQKIKGLSVVIKIKNSNPAMSKNLLKQIGFVFKKKK